MCWQAKLNQSLTQIQGNKGQLRIAILGVGHELRGDDALGVIAVRKIMEKLHDPLANPPDIPAFSRAELLLIDAGPMPENFSSQLRDFQPGLLLVIDAARLDQPPGTIAWIEAQEVDDSSFSTHSLPLSLILNYLAAEAGCETAIVGIQPADLSFGAPLSGEIRLAVDTLVNGFAAEIRSQLDQLMLLNVSIA